MTLEISGIVWYWKGPSPFHFVSVSEAEAVLLREIAPRISYGWGMIPGQIRIGNIVARTALFPKDGTYVVPIKDRIRKAEGIEVGDTVQLVLEIPM